MNEVGKILIINDINFGFIEYDSDYELLTTYSISDGNKVYFNISYEDFNYLYSNSDYGICKETIDFIFKDNKRIDSILKKIKPTMIFIGDDNEEYVFLKYDDKKIYFCKEELCFYDKPDFINSLTNNVDLSYMNMMHPVRFKHFYNELSNERKVRRAINCIRLLLLDKYNSEILEIGNIVKAKIYSENIEYELIGLQIELKINLINNDESNTIVIFSPIYISMLGDYCITSLNDLFKGIDFNVPQTYVNNLGNMIKIEEILITKEDLQDIEFQF